MTTPQDAPQEEDVQEDVQDDVQEQARITAREPTDTQDPARLCRPLESARRLLTYNSPRAREWLAHAVECPRCQPIGSHLALQILQDRGLLPGGHVDPALLSLHRQGAADTTEIASRPPISLLIALHLRACTLCRDRLADLEAQAAATPSPGSALSDGSSD